MPITQLPKSDWDEPGAPFPLCILPVRPDEISERWGIQFTEFDDDGLGLCQAAIVRAGELVCMLESHPEGLPGAEFITVFVRSTEADSLHALHQVLAAVVIPRHQLVWESEYLGPAAWALLRLDDNGNEFEIQRYLLEASAQWVKANYEKKGHKQLYFVRSTV